MKTQINKAIKAAGLNKIDFEITSTDFECVTGTTAQRNTKANKVVKALGAAGISTSSYKTGYGVKVVKIGAAARGVQYEVDYCSTASVWHY